MTENIPASPGRMTFQLVNVDDKLNVKPIFGRSGIIHTLVDADGYIIIDTDKEGVNKGDKVIVYYL
jgi:molybdopterin molybdotransferase